VRLNVTYEIVEYDPPRRTRFQVIDGPIRPAGTITVEPVVGGTRSRLTLELDYRWRKACRWPTTSGYRRGRAVVGAAVAAGARMPPITATGIATAA
jgi:hypothetical protein